MRYANAIAQCTVLWEQEIREFIGQHDRPWPDRALFGRARYLNAAGLERKCDIRAYVAKVDRLVGAAATR